MTSQAANLYTDRTLEDIFHEKTESYEVPEEERKIKAIDAVQKCLIRIRWCRRRKYSWDVIAELIRISVKEAYGNDIKLSGRTLRNYYYELTR
jgi:hypothetical protein